MNKNEYDIETIEDMTGDNEHRMIVEFGNVDFNDIVESFIHLLDEHEKLEIDTHWRSKINEFIDYDYRPFFEEGFFVRKFIFSKDITLVKYIAFELGKLLDNLIELEKNLEAKSYTDKKHTEVTNET